MSSPDRRTFLLAPLALAACGFTPVYGPGGSGSALQGQVGVSPPDNNDEYLLVRHMEERLGRASLPRYQLNLTLRTRQEGLGIDADGNIDRYNIIGAAGYVLSDVASGAELSSGTVNGFTGYSATGTPVVTAAAEEDARARLMTILGNQIVTRLLAADLAA